MDLISIQRKAEALRLFPSGQTLRFWLDAGTQRKHHHLMEQILLPYGSTNYTLQWNPALLQASILLPQDPPPLRMPHEDFQRAAHAPLQGPPLRELGAAMLALSRQRKAPARVVIAIADHTRPVPDHLLVPWIVEALAIPDAFVTVLVGTGTHRGSTSAELDRMLGDASHRFRVLNHDCQAPDLISVGRSDCGGECWLNPAWVEADLRIATGFIEPHFYAGFSGGSKAIVPGIAGLTTIEHFHRAKLIADPRTTWGSPEGNPLQQLTRAFTALCPPHFIVNVTLNRAKQITGMYIGNVTAAHDKGCEAALEECAIPVHRTFPLVVTTNGGEPLDQNFYQTVKGICAASRIVSPGGTILMLSRCHLGLPSEGSFDAILRTPQSSETLLQQILNTTKTQHDQWQVQSLLQCLQKARVILYSELTPAQKAVTRTEHCDDPHHPLEAFAHQNPGGEPRPFAILPLGPLSIPTLHP